MTTGEHPGRQRCATLPPRTRARRLRLPPGSGYDTLSYMTDVPPTPIDRSVEGRSATPLVIGMLLVALGVVAYFAFGMPGMDHSAPSTDSAMSSHNSHRSVDPAAFKAAMVDDDTVTINVHVPASAVKLDGTELVLPFDDLDTGQLPEIGRLHSPSTVDPGRCRRSLPNTSSKWVTPTSLSSMEAQTSGSRRADRSRTEPTTDDTVGLNRRLPRPIRRQQTLRTYG